MDIKLSNIAEGLYEEKSEAQSNAVTLKNHFYLFGMILGISMQQWS